ncbi:hypothetical protein [Microbacterium sp. cf046]|nr:hypothetical protein [Microbacterium sp. cf046]
MIVDDRHVIVDVDAMGSTEGDAPDSVAESILRQSIVVCRSGLIKVVDGV